MDIQMTTLPSFTALQSQYPGYLNFTSPQVKELIGGKVNYGWITNTCAIRLSRTLNYNSIELPNDFAGLNVVSGEDKKWYAFRVRELRQWLTHELSAPAFDLTKKEGEAFDKTTISARKGIIGFDIRFSDATGHLDLWDGNRFTSEHQMSVNYWEQATRIWIWPSA